MNAPRNYMTAAEAVTRARRLKASDEAIIWATLLHMPRPEALAMLDRIRSEIARQHQRAVHAAPIGSRRTA